MIRRGTVLIVVAGMTALIAALCLAFIQRMRGEAEDGRLLARELQARVMLMAGCGYVLEAARVGYDADPATSDHPEAYGWIDVRPVFGGAPQAGPRGRDGAPLWQAPGPSGRPRWPAIGAVARCPMHVLRRTPYAVSPAAAYNPMASDPADPGYGRPLLRWPDPQPATANGWPAAPADAASAAAAVDAARYGDFARGDRAPRGGTTGLAWFRCYRESAARFVITCGAGGTLGFRDWDEVVAHPGGAESFGDRQAFERARDEETRLWYRVEWSDAVGSIWLGGFVDNEIYPDAYRNGPGPEGRRSWDHWLLHPVNSSQRSAGSRRNNLFRPNHCGTIRWIERLDRPPQPAAPGAAAW